MIKQSADIILTDTERQQYREWLEEALQRAQRYNGSEKTEQELLQPLLAMDTLVKSKNHGQPSGELERTFANDAWPDKPPSLHSINDCLQIAYDTYLRKLQEAHGYRDVLSLIEKGGGVVKHSPETFVQTDEGQIKAATTTAPQPVEIKTQPRLASVLQHLKDEGIYTDDIVAHVCTPDRHMVRTLPYILVQIPRLDKEIAVCDEVGESTFVSNKILGADVWAKLTKDQLKARPEITAVTFTNEKNWWNRIREVLTEGPSLPQKEKVDVTAFSSRQQPLDSELIKQTILAHRMETGRWPTQDSGEVRHGPYKGKMRWLNLHNNLQRGDRGLPGGSSLAALNEEVSREHGLDYVNHLKLENLDITKIKESILAHRRQTGKWPTRSSGDVLYGPYERETSWLNLDSNLHRGDRGLPSGSSIAALNEEVSREHGLDYVNPKKQEDLDIAKIKESILAHRRQTGNWPTQDSDIVLHGPYKNQTKWNLLQAHLVNGGRGLPGGSSLAALNEEVSREHGLDYVNHLKLENLDITKIKESILAHRRQTGKWPTRSSGDVLYGPYEGETNWLNLDSNLHKGGRGLPGGSSLAALNEDVSREHGLDYVNFSKLEDLDIAKIKECILAHRRETNKWPTQDSGEVLYGPYTEQIQWNVLQLHLRTGGRGLPGGSSLAALNEEVSGEQGLDYVNHHKVEALDIARIKQSILAHRRETNKWPTQYSGEVLYGPYTEQTRWGNLDAYLRNGVRGLPGGSSLTALNEEVSREHGLDYKRGKHSAHVLSSRSTGNKNSHPSVS